MSRYAILINILDKIRKEAPEEKKSYNPSIENFEKINYARSKAFIHLFLKVKFGILDFRERELFVTDGTNDGGIDGYYIDKPQKLIYFIQAKFRTNEKNFEVKEIALKEILSMEINRILSGEDSYENGQRFNGKVLGLIREIEAINDIGKYRYKVILLANLSSKITSSKLKKLTGGYDSEIFNFLRSYNELVFPVVTGTLFKASEININISLLNKSEEPHIKYDILTKYGECEVRILFVPTIEIGKLMSIYKNSILEYNPRSFLTLKEGTINSEIKKTITESETNEFAVFNNGITILSDDTYLNTKIAKKGQAQLCLTNPQNN